MSDDVHEGKVMMPLTRRQKQMTADNAKWPDELTLIPAKEWPKPHPSGLKAVMRSKTFLAQVFEEIAGAVRVTVCRTEVHGGRWTADITWDELQQLKCEAGFGDLCAVELFPPDGDVVNVANMRHLWVLLEPPSFMWRAKRCNDEVDKLVER